jgi:hypothetical protein
MLPRRILTETLRYVIKYYLEHMVMFIKFRNIIKNVVVFL